MVDFSQRVYGVAVFIWIFFFGSVIGLGSVLIYAFRERFKRKYYELRFPEKLIRVIVHYKTGTYREFYRLIPDDKTFSIGQKVYEFDDKTLIKQNDFYSFKKDGKTKIRIDKKEYSVEDELGIKQKRSKYPELHYFYNVPHPIKYDYSNKNINFSGSQLQDFKENDLFKKLLTLKDEMRLMQMILIISLVSALGVVFLILREFEMV